MFAFYLVGYAAVAGLVYWRAYKNAPLMEEFDAPTLTLWVNPAMADAKAADQKTADLKTVNQTTEEAEVWRKAA